MRTDSNIQTRKHIDTHLKETRLKEAEDAIFVRDAASCLDDLLVDVTTGLAHALLTKCLFKPKTRRPLTVRSEQGCMTLNKVRQKSEICRTVNTDLLHLC